LDMKECDLAVIGAGPAGLSAALYAGRRKARVMVFEEKMAGGAVNITPAIENYPGYKKVEGSELAQKMRGQAEAVESVEIVSKEVVSASGKCPEFVLEAGDGEKYSAKAVVLATGAEHRKLGIPGEKEFAGKGVVYCATCDAPLFEGKTVAVIGGGNTAFNSALMIAGIVKKLFLVHRREGFRAEQVLVERLKQKENVEFVLNAVPTRVKGGEMVEELEYADAKTKERKSLKVDGVFVNVGVTPVSDLAEALGAEVSEHGYVKTDLATCETSAEGVFAAGDVTGWWKQVVAAAAQGGLAGENAAKKALEN
jgi:thioredoxin reductase (NADPH)